MESCLLTQADAGVSRDQQIAVTGIIGAGSGMRIVLMIASAYFVTRNGMGNLIRDFFFLIGVSAFLGVTFSLSLQRNDIQVWPASRNNLDSRRFGDRIFLGAQRRYTLEYRNREQTDLSCGAATVR